MLEGARAFVTGGSRGIGAAIATALAEAGAEVAIGSRGGTGASISGTRSLVLDVTDIDSVAEAFREVGPIDILVNGAGQVRSAPFARHSDELWQDMLAVNLTGAFNCIRAALPSMLERGRGRVINIASTGALKGYPYVVGYVAAKHGLLGMTRALAAEYAKSGVTFNAICPGYTRTDLFETSVAEIVGSTGRTREQVEERLTANNPQGRLIEPSEIAEAVLWLASPGAQSVTGQSVALAGGEVS